MVEILSNSNWDRNVICANALMNYMTNGQLGDARIDKAWKTASLNDLWCFFRWITQEKSYRQILPYAKPSSQVSLVEDGGSALRLFESLEYLLIPSEGCKIKGGLYFFCYMFYHGNGFEEKCLNLLKKILETMKSLYNSLLLVSNLIAKSENCWKEKSRI